MRNCKKILSGLLAVGLLVNLLNVGKIASAHSDKWEKTINSRLHSQIKKLEEKMNLLNREIELIKEKINRLQQELNEKIAELREDLKFLYKTRGFLDWEIMLNDNDLENFDNKHYISKKFNDRIRKLIESLKRINNKLNQLREEYDKIIKELSELKVKSEELNKENAQTLSNVSRNNVNLQKKSVSKKNNGSEVKLSEAKVLTSKRKCWPVLGSMKISSGWGGKRRHNGTDISADEGTKVVAAAAGIVIKINSSDSTGNGWGYYVRILHPDGSITMYAHLSRVFVHVGQHVQAGELIGAVGNTGRSTGPHLHFGVMINGRWVNPMEYLGMFG